MGNTDRCAGVKMKRVLKHPPCRLHRRKKTHMESRIVSGVGCLLILGSAMAHLYKGELIQHFEETMGSGGESISIDPASLFRCLAVSLLMYVSLVRPVWKISRSIRDSRTWRDLVSFRNLLFVAHGCVFAMCLRDIVVFRGKHFTSGVSASVMSGSIVLWLSQVFAWYSWRRDGVLKPCVVVLATVFVCCAMYKHAEYEAESIFAGSRDPELLIAGTPVPQASAIAGLVLTIFFFIRNGILEKGTGQTTSRISMVISLCLVVMGRMMMMPKYLHWPDVQESSLDIFKRLDFNYDWMK